MKKILIFAVLFILITATIAFAGIFGTVTNYVKSEALSIVIGGIIGALGMFGISYKLWGKAVKELGDCLFKIYAATRPISNGGKEITSNEMAAIVKEASEIYPAVQAALASRKKTDSV